jgi:hypothetical protein
VTPRLRARAQASNAAVFGAPVGHVGSLERYTRLRSGKLYERLVDPQSGVITEENLAENGALRVHTQHRYLTLANGMSLRVGTRTQLANPAGGQGTVIDVSFSDIHVDTLGGSK